MSLLSNTCSVPLLERLHAAGAATPALMADVIDELCHRFPSRQPERTRRVGQLIRLGAWTDAALALVELELPQWRLRRLVYDGGEWHCALSRQRELPDWLDRSVEGRHADLALAILSALIEVERIDPPAVRSSVPPAGRKDGPLYEPLCCDSFA